jgi:phenylacetic acid degradation operon negative regulatory protein
MKVETACRRLIKEYRSRPTLRSGSLITTVFGDAIAPRGGNVWLGSLIKVMSDFGVSERLVRTSVFRLVKGGWLQSEQIGRRSYYSLSDDGRERFARSENRQCSSPRRPTGTTSECSGSGGPKMDTDSESRFPGQPISHW